MVSVRYLPGHCYRVDDVTMKSVVALDGPFCSDISSMWSHIAGWEVVAALGFITFAWTSVSIARYYFMAKLAQHAKEYRELLRDD